MSGTVGNTSSEMVAAAQNFKNCVLEFDRATQNIKHAVNNLASTWKGKGYESFTHAMGKWDTDMKHVGEDLQHLTDAVQKTDTAFQDLDSNISKAFSGF